MTLVEGIPGDDTRLDYPWRTFHYNRTEPKFKRYVTLEKEIRRHNRYSRVVPLLNFEMT